MTLFLSFFYSFVSIHFCNYFSHWNHKIQRNMCGLLLNGEYQMQFTFSFFYLFFHVWFSTLSFPGRWHNTYHDIPCPKRKTKQWLHSTRTISVLSVQIFFVFQCRIFFKNLCFICRPLLGLPSFWMVITLSGFLGLAISFTSMWFLHQTGATTYRYCNFVKYNACRNMKKILDSLGSENNFWIFAVWWDL